MGEERTPFYHNVLMKHPPPITTDISAALIAQQKNVTPAMVSIVPIVKMIILARFSFSTLRIPPQNFFPLF